MNNAYVTLLSSHHHVARCTLQPHLVTTPPVRVLYKDLFPRQFISRSHYNQSTELPTMLTIVDELMSTNFMLEEELKEKEIVIQEQDLMIAAMRAQLRAYEQCAEARIEEAQKEANAKVEYLTQKYLEHLEELEAQIELMSVKKTADPVDMYYHPYYETDSEKSDDEGPEPTSDFAGISSKQLKESFESMSEALGNAEMRAEYRELELQKQVAWTKQFFMENSGLVGQMKFGEMVPEKVQELLMEAVMDGNNLQCRMMDVKFLESLI
ncbi:hypothetical protein B9Z55_017193 [Caenorhabditis nigoni]|uniref:Uncharacterized protein n=1 Tax=Caenorhabditis nigoni TaxID=1611254 RepID=A0A2G5T8J4_9PELO|nr:hypothetical protein B9Z55_017193 [Caenorhabditis nigoni]